MESFQIWPSGGCSPWILPKIGLIYDGFNFNVRCVSCSKISCMMSFQSPKAAVSIHSIPETVRFSLHDKDCPWLDNGECRNLPINYNNVNENGVTSMVSDDTVTDNRIKELRRIKSLNNTCESFGNDQGANTITLCLCPTCQMQFCAYRGLLLERLTENLELNILINSKKMSSRICHDPIAYRQRDVATRSLGCGLTETGNGTLCAACETEILPVEDEQNLFSDTCLPLHLSKVYINIRKVLQELKILIRRKSSSITMESQIALTNVYADNVNGDQLCPEMSRKIVAAAIDYFFLHDGTFGNASDIAEILEQWYM